MISYDISIIIVSYNTRDMTIACVQSLLDNSDGISVQIIVVDNGSSDGSSDALRDQFDTVMVIDSPMNGGFSYGNNIGFEQAEGRYLLVLNPDTQIFASGLQKSIAIMDENHNIGIMGPMVRLANGDQQGSLIRFLSLTHFFFFIFIPTRYLRTTSAFGDMRYADLSRNESHKVDAVSGCFMMVRRAVIEDAGAFDTRFFMYGEETEWCHRINKAGWDIVYNPEVEILHYGAASTGQESEWKSVEMARGHILFMRFTRGTMIARIAAILMFFRDFLRTIYFGFETLFSAFKPSLQVKVCWARVKFIGKSIFKLPSGQNVELPNPRTIREIAKSKRELK